MLKKYHIQKNNCDDVLVRNIYCIGRNYSEHTKELGNARPKEPFFFQKSLPALNTTNKIYLSQNKDIEYEVEIVLLVGKSGISESIEDSLSFVDGYSLGIDLTDREYQNKLKRDKLPWLLSKSFAGSAVVSAFLENPIKDSFWLDLNNERRQQGNFQQMTFSFAEQIYFLSNKIPLMEGDLIFTGTPEGVGPLRVGDKIDIGFGDTILNKLSVLD
jgi:acylpyruvate hydrolase|tara:strand:- start:183 stop:827 length:645 start_codon:yes stop_codon:yes gene_type:complete